MLVKILRWWDCRKVRHNQVPTENKAGSEEPDERQEQSQSRQHVCRSVIRCPADITAWPKEEIETTDIKTRKLLTMHGPFHPSPTPWDFTLKTLDLPRWLVSPLCGWNGQYKVGSIVTGHCVWATTLPIVVLTRLIDVSFFSLFHTASGYSQAVPSSPIALGKCAYFF